MAKYFYHVTRLSGDFHSNSSSGTEELAIDDLELATAYIAARVIRFDVARMGDMIHVYPLDQVVTKTITPELLRKSHE